MICKEKKVQSSKHARIKAGNDHEQSVAFYLRCEFKNQTDILVFNDLMLTYDDERCQIDHLIVYRYGFILIESKSITGDVRVNELGEWSRSYNKKWTGMASPIKQVELQQKLLKELLGANASSILGKLIFNKVQLQFGGRSWDNLCAISSNAIINRNSASEAIQKKMVKAEFIVDRCHEIMDLPKGILDSASKFLEARPSFKAEEIENIRKFLLEADKKARPQKSKNAEPTKEKSKQNLVSKDIDETLKAFEKRGKQESSGIKEQKSVDIAIQKVEAKKTIKQESAKTELKSNQENKSTENLKSNVKTDKALKLACKKCGSTDQLTGKWGKYGYYVHCSACDTNTSMKIDCPSCGSKNVKNRKEKEKYFLVCLDCENQSLLYKSKRINA